MRSLPMMARSSRLQSEAGYIDARPHIRQLDESSLAMHGRTIHWVNRATSLPHDARAMSSLLRKRPNYGTAAKRRNVPQADSCTATTTYGIRRSARQSTTSSARISIAEGIVSPSVSTVFLLMTRRNRVGCSNGRSAGRAPLRIRSARSAARS
jgi:hypothetical protein